MNYKLLYTKHALRDIKRLDEVVQRRLKSSLERFGENPLQFAEKLTDPIMGGYRFRMGSYRIIVDIDTQNKVVFVLRIGHRREIYR